MRTKAIVGFLATLLLGIVGTPALLASSAGPQNRHYGGYYDQYRVKELAHDLEHASEKLLYELKRDRYRRSYEAIDAADALEECAEDYKRVVRKYDDYRRGYDMYRGLVKLYNETEYAMNYSRNSSAHQELYRVGQVLGALEREYSRASGHTYYRGSRDRYERDRYGRYETGRRYDDWRYRGRSRGGATIELPRIRLRLPF